MKKHLRSGLNARQARTCVVELVAERRRLRAMHQRLVRRAIP